jgi:CheY-like chemotaxis protein
VVTAVQRDQPLNAASAGDRRRILLIEDEPLLCEILVETLGEDGYEVRAARDGPAALEILHSAWLPHLILLDVVLPAMDAHDFRARQQELGLAPGVPIIVLTAGRDVQEQAQVIGAVAGVEKPFDLIALVDLVQRTVFPTA